MSGKYVIEPVLAAAIRETLGIMAGQASMAWDPLPSGVFDSSGAQDALVSAFDSIQDLLIETEALDEKFVVKEKS